MANHALGGEAVLDTSTASTAYPLFDWTSWDPEVAASLGVDVDQLPRLVPTGVGGGRVGGADGPVLASGCIDVLADQIVAGADTRRRRARAAGHDAHREHGDAAATTPVAGLLGDPAHRAGHVPRRRAEQRGRAVRQLGDRAARRDVRRRAAAIPHRVPVWAPYPRGERVPLHDPDRRGVLADLDLTHDAAAIRRAAFEASGFVARRMIDAARDAHGVDAAADRRDRRRDAGRRVGAGARRLHRAARSSAPRCPEGAALGSAFLARCAAGLEAGGDDWTRARWARPGRTVEPDPAWVEAAAAPVPAVPRALRRRM